MKNRASRSVNQLYHNTQKKYSDARANGYRFHTYFLKEQEVVLSALSDIDSKIIMDIGCGSGMMLKPLINQASLLIGLDYNVLACKLAFANSLTTIRSDAFNLPIIDNSIDRLVCCQFLNQQSHEDIQQLLAESYRVLKKKGRLILVWRNGDALIHKISHALFHSYDLIFRKEIFPIVNHPISLVKLTANAIGFKTITGKAILPIANWESTKTDSILSKLIGASYFLILENP